MRVIEKKKHIQAKCCVYIFTSQKVMIKNKKTICSFIFLMKTFLCTSLSINIFFFKHYQNDNDDEKLSVINFFLNVQLILFFGSSNTRGVNIRY